MERSGAFQAGVLSKSAGITYVGSASESWAESDLSSAMIEAGENAPMFLEAFYDACEDTRGKGRFAPNAKMINELCEKHDIGYILDPPFLRLREKMVTPVATPPPSPTLADQANELLQQSLNRSEELLAEGRDREAVQESLWVLESVVTAFRGVDFGGDAVGGRYFNQIVRELRKVARGTTLDRVAEWCSAIQGYLSSPTGGGVRHGIDLSEGVPIERNEARLFCNLIRSYIVYFLAEHERIQNDGVSSS